MKWCLRSALILSVLLFVPGLVDAFESPKAAAVRTCGLAALGLALGIRSLRGVRWQAVDFAVLAWLLAQLLATAFSTAPLLSVFGGRQQNEGLLTSLGLAGLYLAARLEARETGDLPGFGLASAVVSVAAAYGLVQTAGLDPFEWSRAMAKAWDTSRTFTAGLRTGVWLGKVSILITC